LSGVKAAEQIAEFAAIERRDLMAQRYTLLGQSAGTGRKDNRGRAAPHLGG
jgi:hypothetical protein